MISTTTNSTRLPEVLQQPFEHTKPTMQTQRADVEDPSTWHWFAELDQEFQKLSKSSEARFVQDHKISSLPETRKRWHALWIEDAKKALEAAAHVVDQEEIFIPVRDNTKVRALVFRPKVVPADGLPLAIIIHGGGFCIGNAEMEAEVCIEATKTHDCITLSLEYRLSPEVKFPVAYEDCWDAITWVSKNAKSLGADLSKGFILGGTSAGGHLSIPLGHKARDEGLDPPLTGMYLNASPALMPEDVPESYKALYQSRAQLSNGISLTTNAIDMFELAVEPDHASALWNPLLWPTGHANIPPTFFQICGADMLRDEVLIYERVLRKDHGVKTKVEIYQGLPHVFWYDFPEHSKAKTFAKDAANGLGWLLGQP